MLTITYRFYHLWWISKLNSTSVLFSRAFNNKGMGRHFFKWKNQLLTDVANKRSTRAALGSALGFTHSDSMLSEFCFKVSEVDDDGLC